ncbi:MAG TPA: hypothetical protein VNM90_02530, partial [Haliangium sp.]|nr:hypothetical protein [Haliangium sp.]
MKSTRSFQNPLDTRLAGPAVTVFHVCTVLALSSGAAFAQAPDTGGDTIAFYYDGAIRLMNEDGTSQRVLRLGMQPAWSPDGTHLVSMCTADDTSNEICLTDVRSGYSMELTNSPFWEVNMWPTFSPDGEKI